MNRSPVATRSVLLALVLGFSAAAACVDEESLENEECLTDDDCFNSQECVATDYQRQLPAPVGWCRPKNEGCAKGDQPGCSCEAEGIELCCNSASTFDGTTNLLPHLHPSLGCICVLEGDMTFPPEADQLGGCVNAS